MSLSLSFHGAAGTVTGSCFLLRHPGGRVLVDCGLFQGPKTVRELNYGPFPFDPRGIDAVLLTHAHIDHSGLIPKLVKGGFAGRVLTTAGTRDLLTYMLPDSGHIQETDVARLNRRNAQRGRRQVEPIYGRAEAEAALDQIEAVPRDVWVEVATGVRARFWNAGHLLGSASIELAVADGSGSGRDRHLLFSGDLGPGHKAFHADPDGPAGIDHLIVESTYGDRDRKSLTPDQRRAALRDEVAAALAAGGNLIIPAFAVERTQELLHDLLALFDAGALPRVPVFIDSPLAIRATDVFAQHLSDPDTNGGAAPGHGAGLFRADNVQYLPEAEDSRALDRIRGGAILLAASGMCDAGRIRHHLRANLWRKESTLLIVGYQAPGTLGRILLEGAPSVRIHGEEVRVAARIRQLDAYSGHADREELLAWIAARAPVRGSIFLTHGSHGALATLRRALLAAGHADGRVLVPELDATAALHADGSARLSPPKHPRLTGEPPERDWHNDYAATVLALSEALRSLPNDAARQALLQDLRGRIAATEA